MCRRPIIAVFGGNGASSRTLALAGVIGSAIAALDFALLTGGAPTTQGNVKNRAALAAQRNLGATLALLPKDDPIAESSARQMIVSTNWTSFQRNPFSASITDAAIVLSGKAGTIAEAAFALHFGKPILFVDTERFAGMDPAEVSSRITEGLQALSLTDLDADELRAAVYEAECRTAAAAPAVITDSWAKKVVEDLRKRLPACLGALELPSSLPGPFATGINQWSQV
ncbi:hypothetical protein [Kaistia terrae]|uniref:Uncharacterized protein n=1 Tax=Kaistia terrae TaxID=537017 RepID=A0ABW0PZT7_9HYPH|nr:hypothetical protein [Kaistia terrae]MCX5578927.1 hypothetical protein [Kaistia terrae]